MLKDKLLSLVQDTFEISSQAFKDSKAEANHILDLYHGRHYTAEQLAVLQDRKQPAEYFNIIKLFTNVLVGYYSTVSNKIQVTPNHFEYSDLANLLSDVVSQVLQDSNFELISSDIKKDGFISGLFCVYHNLVEKGTDEFGRPHIDIVPEYIPSSEILLDPESVQLDYSDANYIHRYKWVNRQQIINKFGKEALEDLIAYDTANLDVETYEDKNFDIKRGINETYDSYLIIHSIIKRDNKTYEVYWGSNSILSYKEITLRGVKFPYRVVKLYPSNISEYYGTFRDIAKSQDSINQALIQIQALVNTNKVFIELGSIKDLGAFEQAFNRVNSIIPTLKNSGIRIDKSNGEIQENYRIIDNAMSRIKQSLGINDSFLGMAFASDSGRKVQLQRDATSMALKHLDNKLVLFYTLLGTDLLNLTQQFYKSTRLLRFTDSKSRERWLAINQPIMLPDEQGNPRVEYVEVIDEDNGEVLTDNKGLPYFEPLSNLDSHLSYGRYKVKIEIENFTDEANRKQMLIETVMGGIIGQTLQQVNPQGLMEMAELLVENSGAKVSRDIAEIIGDTAKLLQPQPEKQQDLTGNTQGTPPARQPSTRN